MFDVSQNLVDPYTILQKYRFTKDNIELYYIL